MTLAALSAQARAAQRTAVLLADRDRALVDLSAMLDPHRTRPAWQIAGEVAELLRRFLSVAHKRIEAGHRGPRGDVEPLLLSLVRGDCPASQRRLYDLLRELTRAVNGDGLESPAVTHEVPHGRVD